MMFSHQRCAVILIIQKLSSISLKYSEFYCISNLQNPLRKILDKKIIYANDALIITTPIEKAQLESYEKTLLKN